MAPKREPLPELMDAKMIAAETGLPLSTARTIAGRCPTVRIGSIGRNFVRRGDVLELMRTERITPERASQLAAIRTKPRIDDPFAQ